MNLRAIQSIIALAALVLGACSTPTDWCTKTDDCKPGLGLECKANHCVGTGAGGATGGGTGGGATGGGTGGGASDAGASDAGASDSGVTDGGTGGGAAAGETCQAPDSLTTSPMSSTLVGYANDYDWSSGSGCAATFSPSGSDRVFAVSIPAQQRFVATVTPDVGLDAVLQFVQSPASSCPAALADGGSPVATCLESADTGSDGEAETLSVLNDTGATVTGFFVVDAYRDAPDSGTFTVDYTIAAPAAGDVCFNATAVDTTTLPVTLSGQTTIGFDSDIDTDPVSCTGYSTSGADRVYVVTVPAGKQLTATVSPTGATAWDSAIYLVAGPASNCLSRGTTCLAGDDSGDAGSPDAASWTNSGAASADVFVVVDAFGSMSAGTFDLKIELN